MLIQKRFPRVCGDGPDDQPSATQPKQVSPRVWGWTLITIQSKIRNRGFPACVGMDP